MRDFQYNEEEMKADKEEMTRLSTDKKKQFVSDGTGHSSTLGSLRPPADLFKEPLKWLGMPQPIIYHTHLCTCFVIAKHTLCFPEQPLIHFSYNMKINIQRPEPCMRKVHYSEDLVTLFYNKVTFICQNYLLLIW